ncbi:MULTISPECIES: hypothetical protein [unclassified Bradyrhizobium]|nr:MULTISPECIES: hypothetical protein [unclassified Bradyrhizobium]
MIINTSSLVAILGDESESGGLRTREREPVAAPPLGRQSLGSRARDRQKPHRQPALR